MISAGKNLLYLFSVILALSILAGCQTEPEPEYIETDTPRGTPLMELMVINDDPVFLRGILQEEERDINAMDRDGRTALMYAARFNRNPEVIELLLEFGADASLKSVEGKTAYDYAAEYNENLSDTDAFRKLYDAQR